LKTKGFKEATVTKIGLYDIVKSTTLESNKSLIQIYQAIKYLSLDIAEFIEQGPHMAELPGV